MSSAPATTPGEVTVRDNPERGRYEAYVGSALAGYTDYHAQPGLVTVLHTEVDPTFEGRGVGSELVRGMLDDIRRPEHDGAPGLPVRARVPATPSRGRGRGLEAMAARLGLPEPSLAQ